MQEESFSRLSAAFSPLSKTRVPNPGSWSGFAGSHFWKLPYIAEARCYLRHPRPPPHGPPPVCTGPSSQNKAAQNLCFFFSFLFPLVQSGKVYSKRALRTWPRTIPRGKAVSARKAHRRAPARSLLTPRADGIVEASRRKGRRRAAKQGRRRALVRALRLCTRLLLLWHLGYGFSGRPP